MKLKRVRIQNFRCLEDVELYFDNVTTLIGPNGSGKSSILRALDWFFNGEKSLIPTEEDIYAFATERRISVEVEFDSLTEQDRSALGKYAPSSVGSVVIWRRWEEGTDKITGKALAYPPFENVRRQSGASEQRRAFNELRLNCPELGLPSANSARAVEEAMLAWEREHPTELVEAEVATTNFFGFAGQAKMSGLFDFVLVTADLRASEEAQDSRSAVLGRILERAVDRTVADSELTDLAERIKDEQRDIYSRNFSSQLEELSRELSEAVGAFTEGRTIKISPAETEVRQPKAQFSVSVLDSSVETRVGHQGHGFQRTLLISALKLLAEHGAAPENPGVICLAIEEPELFQHPVQARAFTSVLRRLAEDPAQNFQITYATHSPYFIEATHFGQIRRINRFAVPGGTRPTTVASVTADDVVNKLAGSVKEETVRRRLDDVCLTRLPEALFAEIAVLVEGDTDRAILEGCSERSGSSLAVEGIVVAEVGGKPVLLLPYAILTLLGIPCFVVFDADAGCEARMRDRGKSESDIVSTKRNEGNLNRDLLRHLGQQEEAWPATHAGDGYAVFEDTLEGSLEALWSEWSMKRRELVDSGLGFSDKNTATYRYAAQTAHGSTPLIIGEVLTKIRELRRRVMVGKSTV